MARREATVHRSRRSMYATVLWFLLVLFCLRVAGQALVAAFAVPFLPPMRQWYSGVLPYPILLPVQILIIVLLAKVATDFTRRRGFFVVPRRTMGRLLQWSSYLYWGGRSEEHTSELQSRLHLVCRLLLEKKNTFTYGIQLPPCAMYV